jgi:hypothetical protein
VGADKVVVTAGAGRVSVLKGTDRVIWACTVSAAAVNTALGSSVTGAFDGRLQAESIKMMAVKIETLRATLGIVFSSSLCKAILLPVVLYGVRGIPCRFPPMFCVACGVQD